MFSYHIAWDLLRIDIYGFEALCHTFLERNTEHYICPLRLSGSAVESLFGQLKFSAGGKLDAVKYQTSQASVLTKQALSGHHSTKGYRDTTLSIHAMPLEKKKYARKQS